MSEIYDSMRPNIGDVYRSMMKFPDHRTTVGLKFRPEVDHFAQAMEYKLKRNDHKGGWADTSTEDLFKRLREEVDELEKAITNGNRYEITMEAADIGNFAMMIAHNNTGNTNE